MTGKNETFVMDDYGKKSTFASFLPGIAGIRGIPIWCYYVNRGQCVVSFGVDNKDHAMGQCDFCGQDRTDDQGRGSE